MPSIRRAEAVDERKANAQQICGSPAAKLAHSGRDAATVRTSRADGKRTLGIDLLTKVSWTRYAPLLLAQCVQAQTSRT